MSLASALARAVNAAEARATLANPSEALFNALTAGGKTYSGKTVSTENSLHIIPVFSTVQRIATAVAGFPMMVYLGDDRAENTTQWRILHDRPNDEMVADEYFELVTTHLLLWGNSFTWKERGPLGTIDQLWPIRPNRVAVGRLDGRKVFIIDGDESRPYFEDSILHIRALGTDGLLGLSPIQLARQQLGNMLAVEEFQGKFWKDGAMVGGVIEHPLELTPDAAKRIARNWSNAHAGLRNAHRVAVLEEGARFRTTGMPLDDAQFIEQQQMSDLRVAQLFLLGPHFLGAPSGDSQTYSNVENEGINFVRWTARRWTTRIERAIANDPTIMPPVLGLRNEFLLDALMRADTKTRYDTYAVGVASRVLLPNEARGFENLPPLEGGDEFYVPEPVVPAGDTEGESDATE